MSQRFRIEVDGKPEFDRAFNRIDKHINDMRPVWDYVQPEFYAIEREQFDSEGSAGASGKWPALSPQYAKQKASEYPGKKIMERTGRLRSALTGRTAHSVIEKEKDQLTLGTRLPYGRWHQRGAGKLPVRKAIDMSRGQKRRIQKAIQRGLLNVMRSDSAISKVFEIE